MRVCRGVYALGLLAFVATPLLMPFAELMQPAAWRWTQDDIERLLRLASNTLALTAGTVVFALPLGTCLAVLLFRTTFFGRRFLLFFLAIALFVPLPIVVSSWQGFFGSDGWLPVSLWHGTDYRPWVTGMGPAIWISVLAAIPWVTFIVGLSLTWVEPELEDEAAQIVGPWRVLFLVALPRVRASVLAAGLFVILQTAGEVSVTDMMLVSTLAEEVRAQFALGDRGRGQDSRHRLADLAGHVGRGAGDADSSGKGPAAVDAGDARPSVLATGSSRQSVGGCRWLAGGSRGAADRAGLEARLIGATACLACGDRLAFLAKRNARQWRQLASDLADVGCRRR